MALLPIEEDISNIESLFKKEDLISLAIRSGIDYIYELYAEGKISNETARIRLEAFLDSQGDHCPQLAAMNTVKNWKR
jgi:hypothetical protein